MAIDLDVHGNTKPLEAAVQAAVNRIRRQPIKITVDDKGATQPLGNMKRGADEFSKSMEAANARILAFGASMAIINGVANAFKGMVKNLVEVEKAMADVNVVMGLSAQNLDKFSDGLFKVAKETGAAFKVAADAATEYARQGLGVEESLKRTRDALILTRLTGMDSAEAVKSLTAAMNTYGTQIKDTTQLVSKFAAVDVKFAVSAQDFADAISRTGQSAQSAGVSIDELVGIVTAAQQKTARGGAVIGNALKTIFTKTGRTDTLNQLENLGIAVRDLEGNTIGAQRILSDLANTFDTLSEAQKAQITQTMGGLFHINILKAVLSDAAKQNGIMAEATRISAGATDEAIQKNEELRKTMSAVATETGLAIKQVSTQIGEIALAPGMEKILNAVKSLAEGLSGVLGDGETTGSSFATGFLKGIGNVITGPGLVVLAGVFFKLFGQALKFTKESLTSLVGVTTEKQKQKAIQTSLVALFGQNAALNKEMLRTDIGRTEKEKIILGLLRAQVVEANSLNKLTAGMAGTLYRKGYGANLTPIRKKASGHIPNFANPERAQAAQGGYAAGSIRTMNMPGEGPVIYNSAETVKNFAGFKQPAIMPPQSSKAGKNYQQAFGNIHGFDPYAAGGYIPNFIGSNKNFVSNAYIENKQFRQFAGIGFGDSKSPKAIAARDSLEAYAAKSGLQGLGVAKLVKSYTGAKVTDDPKKSLAAMLVPPEGYKKSYANHKGLTWPVYRLRADAQTDPSLSEMVKGDFKKTGSKYSSKIASVFSGGQTVSGDRIWKSMKSTAGAMGAWQAAVGSLFETAVNTALKYTAQKGARGAGDFDVRGRQENDLLSKAFDGFPPSMLLADFKNDSGSYGNKESFYKKVMKEAKFVKSQKRNKLKTAASGFIPNFADPLSDAIGREKAAGVPVSQIRVGSHGALMNKSNPLGLGVTNTHDEPNGLRDVFGANGFVPNYAEGFAAGDIGKDAGSNDARKALARKINEQIQSIDASIYSEEDYRKEIDKIIKKQKKNGKSIELSKSGLDKASQISKRNTAEIQKNTVSQQANTIASQSNTTQTAANTAKRKTLGAKLVGGIKNMNQGMGGMGLMMGLPMLAGFIPGADKPGSGAGMASGMLSGAATGASIGMMFPGWGTAIGAAVGALGGLVSSLNESNKAVEDEARARRQAMSGKFDQSIRGFIESGLSDIASQPAAEVGGRYFSGYNPNPGETFSDIMFKFSAPEEVLKKIKEGESYTAEESYKDLPSVQEHLKTVRTQAVKSLMVEEGTSNIQKQQQVLSSKMFSILSDRMSGSLSIQDYEGIKAGISEKMQGLNQQKEGIIYKVGSADVKTLRGFQEKNPEAVGAKTMEFLGRTRSQKEILSKAFRGSETKMFSGGKIFKELFGKEQVSGKNILAGLQSKKPQEIELLFSEIANRLQDQEMLKKQENEAIILRLNKEKVLLSAQDKFNKDMRVSSNLLAEMNNQYDYELRTRGHLMTETEKAQNAYNKAINAAAAARYDAERRAEFGQTKKLITTLQGSGFEQEFKKELTDQGLSEQGFADLSVEDQKEIAIEVGKQSGHLQKINAFLRNSSQELSSLKEDYADVEQKAKNRAKTEKDITNELLHQQTGPGSFGRGMEKTFSDMDKQVRRMDYELGQNIPRNLANGLATAMQETLNGAKSLDEALQGAAMNFLQMIQQAMLQKAAMQVVGAMGFSRGGNVRKYSQGGGVPAMVTNGEYVMGRDAVNKYGGSFMHGMNAGGNVPGFSNGGATGSAVAANFGGGRGYESGRAYQGKAMSGFFYSQSGNVGLGEDRESLLGVLAEEEKKRQEALAKKEKRRALLKQIIGTVASIGISAGVSGAFGGSGASILAEKGIPSGSVTKLMKHNPGMTKVHAQMLLSNAHNGLPGVTLNHPDAGSLLGPNSKYTVPKYYGGTIQKYASGGHIAGKSGIDQIPAMLSEGEYVIRASSARQIGRPMLDRINAGKFNDGGAVSEIAGSSETGSTGGNTNNINISINMERGKAKQDGQDSGGQNPADRSNDEQSSAALADRIKQQVVSVIVEEQRPGGLLDEKS